MYPSDSVKTRLIAQHTCHRLAHYNGITDAVITIYKEEGLLAFYRGVSTSLLGVLPFSGVMFLAYEVMDNIWEHHLHKAQSPIRGLINGCIAGAIAQTVTFPLDTMRKKMQAYSSVLWDRGNVDVPSPTIRAALSATVKKYGFWGLWRGCLINNLKIVPYTGLMFLTHETSKNFFIYHNGYTTCPLDGSPIPGVPQNESLHEENPMADEDIY